MNTIYFIFFFYTTKKDSKILTYRTCCRMHNDIVLLLSIFVYLYPPPCIKFRTMNGCFTFAVCKTCFHDTLPPFLPHRIRNTLAINYIFIMPKYMIKSQHISSLCIKTVTNITNYCLNQRLSLHFNKKQKSPSYNHIVCITGILLEFVYPNEILI